MIQYYEMLRVSKIDENNVTVDARPKLLLSSNLSEV